MLSSIQDALKHITTRNFLSALIVFAHPIKVLSTRCKSYDAYRVYVSASFVAPLGESPTQKLNLNPQNPHQKPPLIRRFLNNFRSWFTRTMSRFCFNSN